MRFPHAAKGVKKIFSAEILSLIASLLAGGISIAAVFGATAINTDNEVGAFISGGVVVLLGVAALTLLVFGGIINVIGYIQASMDEKGFKRAIICTIVSIILAIASSFMMNQTGFLGWLGTGLFAASRIFNLLVVLFSIGGLINLSAECNREDMIVKGNNILKVIVAVYVLAILAMFFSRVFQASAFSVTLTGILSIAALVLTVVEYFLYLSFLAKASRMLNEN